MERLKQAGLYHWPKWPSIFIIKMIKIDRIDRSAVADIIQNGFID
jgi:hypothetical protein